MFCRDIMFSCINGTIQVTEGHGYFAQRPRVGQHCVRDKNVLFFFFPPEEVAAMCKQQNSLLALFSVLLVHR